MKHRLWRWAFEYQYLLNMSLAMVVVIVMVIRSARSIAESVAVGQQADGAVAHALAEELADRVVAKLAADDEVTDSIERAGFSARLGMPAIAGSKRLLIDVDSRHGQRFAYRCDVLDGAAPAVLSCRLGIRGAAGDRTSLEGSDLPAPIWLAAADFPRLAPQVDDDHLHGSGLSGGLCRDDSLASLRLAAGTDQSDYRLIADGSGIVHLRCPVSRVLRLCGNLWIEDRSGCLIVELRDDLTLVVEGNLYVGSSLRVRGGGHLVIVTRCGDTPPFKDLDFDGRWSPGDQLIDDAVEGYAGWIEGAGGVWLGLPGRESVAPQLHLEVSVVADAEIHQRAAAVEITGALILGSGLTRESPACRLSLPGSDLLDVFRLRVPGFRVSGAPRPGRISLR